MQALVRMEEQAQTLELELTISQEKHRTCHQEVSQSGVSSVHGNTYQSTVVMEISDRLVLKVTSST